MNPITTHSTLSLLASICLVPLTSTAKEPQSEENAEVRAVRTAFQAKYDILPEVKLNTVKEDVKFQIVDLRKSITQIDGAKYCAFRFKTGKKVSQLTWCFRRPAGLRSWYIFRQKGRMEGFSYFHNFALSKDDEEMGNKGDLCFVQSLTSDHFDPETGYIMWFKIKSDADAAINLSLNMTAVEDGARYSAVFPAIKL